VRLGNGIVKIMVIERITGGKPQDVRSAEATTRKNAPTAQPKDSAPATKSPEVASSVAQVSDRSKAAIKAYRIASEAKPDISRANRVGQIKAQIAQGSYSASAGDIANSIMQNIVKGT